jgi:hypothetical protein
MRVANRHANTMRSAQSIMMASGPSVHPTLGYWECLTPSADWVQIRASALRVAAQTG